MAFGLDSTRPLTFSFGTHNAETGTLQDMHYELELGFVCSGRMHRQSPGWEHTLGPGEIWYCSTWEPHGYRVVEAPCLVGVYVLQPPFLAGLSLSQEPPYDWLLPFTVPPPQRPNTARATRDEVLAVAGRLRTLASIDAPQYEAWLRLSLMELLLVSRRGWHPRRAGPGRRMTPYARISPALRLVHNSRAYVGVQQAAAACGLSRNAFARHFGETMGLGFADFALRSRLKRAAVALIESTAPVKTIAYEWGFTDPSHLSHTFIKHYGCTPGEYRSRARTMQLPA